MSLIAAAHPASRTPVGGFSEISHNAKMVLDASSIGCRGAVYSFLTKPVH